MRVELSEQISEKFDWISVMAVNDKKEKRLVPTVNEFTTSGQIGISFQK